MGAVNANKNAQPSRKHLKRDNNWKIGILTVRPTGVVFEQSKSILGRHSIVSRADQKTDDRCDSRANWNRT
jgi:hypothetical protein